MKKSNHITQALELLSGTVLTHTIGCGEETEFYFESMIMLEGVIVKVSYVLKVNCSWRIKVEGLVKVGSRDILKPMYEDGSLYDHIRYSRADAILEVLLSIDTPRMIMNAIANEEGNTRLFFNGGTILELFINQSIYNEEEEYHWMLYDLIQEKTIIIVK